MMNPEVDIFVGFTVRPSDFLDEIEEERRIDCGHNPDPNAKYCDECGTRLDKMDLKVRLKEDYKNQFDPPDEQYSSIRDPKIKDWLEWKAIRENYESVNTERASDPDGESGEVVVGKCIGESRPTTGEAEILSVPREELEEHLKEVEEILDDLDLDCDVTVLAVEKVH